MAMLLRQLERDLDQAFATGGRLAAALPAARMEAKLSAVVGQQVFDHIGNALLTIGAAWGHTVAGHRVLEVLATKLGLETSYGDEECAMAGVAAFANRFWPIRISGLHLIAIAVHSTKAISLNFAPWMYGVAVGKIACPMLMMLMIGTARLQSRKRRLGRDRDCNHSPWG